MEHVIDIVEKMRLADCLMEKEACLKTQLSVLNLNSVELMELKNSAFIRRYLSLIYIVERYEHRNELSKSKEAAKNESMIKKVLMAFGVGA